MLKFHGLCATIIILLLGSSEGLQCYNCIYVETELPPGINTTIPSDASCLGANGTVPSERFLVDCKNLQFTSSNVEDSNNNQPPQSGVIENGRPLYAVFEPHNLDEEIETIYTCAKFVFNGTLNQQYQNAPFRSTIRTCIPGKWSRVTTFNQGCDSGILSRVMNETRDVEVQVALSNYMQILNGNNTQAVACTCNNDYCNSSLRSSTAIPLIFIILLSFLLIVSEK